MAAMLARIQRQIGMAHAVTGALAVELVAPLEWTVAAPRFGQGEARRRAELLRRGDARALAGRPRRAGNCHGPRGRIRVVLGGRVASGYVLMAIPATCRLDMHLVQAAVGDRHVRLATEEELLRDFPGFELGALPPLGSLLGAPLYVDQEVLQHETVVFAAGSQTESVQIRTADLLQHEQVTALPLIKHADENDKDWLR
jgi:prolyl-tRNA editing enzyme YbaK/EbsC (Cys-tRNA(Pro) deacylase)